MATYISDSVTVLSAAYTFAATLDAYDATTDTILDLRGMKEKLVLMKNTGGANGLTWTILGSVDDGVEYDIVVKADANVALSAQEIFRGSEYYTHWKVRVKSQVAGNPTSVKVKFAAIGT
jgi:hypothetical protein